MKDLAELLQVGGGWGLSALLMFVVYRQSEQKDQLHKELRDTMVDSMKTLSDAVNSSTNATTRQVEELKELKRALPPHRRNED